VKTHYQLLDLAPTASADEIKRAFRREIARYHPDKVQHLGPEFQEIASVRAAELTEAYRVLMDPESRTRYDDAIADGVVEEAPRPAPPPVRERPSEAPQRAERPSVVEAERPSGPDRRFEQERATTVDFVRKATLAKLRSAAAAVAGSATQIAVPSFDAAYLLKPRKALFKKADPAVQLLARVVPHVDAESVEQVWAPAAKAAAADGIVCVLLLGTGVAPARELGGVISEQRRKLRAAAPVIVPIDIRDWEALFPPEAPEIVRQIVQRLRSGD
jgi:DnaJ-like protein